MNELERKSVFSIFREGSGKTSSTRIVLIATVLTVLGLMIASFAFNQPILELPGTVVTLVGAVFAFAGANKYTEKRHDAPK